MQNGLTRRNFLRTSVFSGGGFLLLRDSKLAFAYETNNKLSVAGMKRSKHVYCEKPLTRTVHEARVMRQTAARHKVITQMGNQGSAENGLRRAVELVWDGTIGEVSEAHVWFDGGNGPQKRPLE